MGGIKVYLSDETEKKFRETAMRIFGYGKGSLSIAAERALEEWVPRYAEMPADAEPPEDPIGAIWGLLSHVKKSGVELQHEALRLRAKRAVKSRNVSHRR